MGCGIIEFLFPVEYPQRYMNRDIEEDEIIGMWKITDASESLIETYLQQQDNFWSVSPAPWKAITLYQDGSCEVDLVILWALDNEVLKEDDALATCTWKIDQVSAYDEIGQSKYVPGLFFRFEHYNSQEDTYSIYYSESYVAEENGQLIMWNFIGDPIYLRYQDFHKTDQ